MVPLGWPFEHGPILHPKPLAERWDALVEETARTLFPDVPLDDLRAVISFVFATINGLALDRLFDKEQESQAALIKLIQAVEAIQPTGA